VRYNHSFDAVVRVLEQVLDSLSLGRVTLAFTCANGFYALSFAARRPKRVERLVLRANTFVRSDDELDRAGRA